MDKLKFINEHMDMISVPYEFGEWTSPVLHPYGVGEITEEPITTEDGAEQSTLLLTFFNRGKMIDLLEIKERIKKHFNPISGLRGHSKCMGQRCTRTVDENRRRAWYGCCIL